MRPTRRAFLLSLLGLSALSGGGLAFWNARRAADPAFLVADLIRRRLPYLEIASEDLARFAAEYLAVAGPGELAQIQSLAPAQGLLPALFPFLRREPEPSFAQHQLERRIASRFLLATDFFRQEDPRAVRYVAYPDPYKLGCANPLAVRG